MNNNAVSLVESEQPSSVRQQLQQRLDQFLVERWEGEWQGRHIMRGKPATASAVKLVSNDYLAIANHPDIVAAQVAVLQASPDSVLMSGIFLHGDTPQRLLEQRLAEWTSMPDAILSQSGYAANVGLLQAIAGPGVPVYIDRHAHASLWEGIISAGADARPWRHNDVAHLERQIRKYGPGVVCVDSIYSTTGTLCPLEDVTALAHRTGCLLVVDESHSLGTHGPAGSGLVKALGLSHRVDFITASLAKAFAGRAGLVLCPKGFVDYFWFTARPAIFSSCLLPFEIAGLESTLDVIIDADDRRETLRRNADFLRDGLTELGYNVRASQSQIIALESGLEITTLRLREALEEEGVFGSVFCAPATPKKRALLRMSVHAGLRINELQQILQACENVRERVGMAEWPSTLQLKQADNSLMNAV